MISTLHSVPFVQMVWLNVCAPPSSKDVDKLLLPNFLLNSGNLNHLGFCTYWIL